jgi:predicted secreted protein
MAEFVAKNGNAGLYIGSGSPITYAKIVGVKSFNMGSITTEEIDATDFDSPQGFREFVNGLKSASAGSIVLNYDPGEATQDALETAHGGAPVAFKALFDDKQATFSALVIGFDTPLAAGALAEATVTIKLTGAVTRGNAT